MNQRKEATIGIAGAAGDGPDKTGDTIAKTCSRLGLYLCAYNSYQSVIRGGHIWLRVRVSEQKTYTHGDHLNVLKEGELRIGAETGSIYSWRPFAVLSAGAGLA